VDGIAYIALLCSVQAVWWMELYRLLCCAVCRPSGGWNCIYRSVVQCAGRLVDGIAYISLCCAVCSPSGGWNCIDCSVVQCAGRLVDGIRSIPSEFKSAPAVSTYQEVHISLIVGVGCECDNTVIQSPVRKCSNAVIWGGAGVSGVCWTIPV